MDERPPRMFFPLVSISECSVAAEIGQRHEPQGKRDARLERGIVPPKGRTLRLNRGTFHASWPILSATLLYREETTALSLGSRLRDRNFMVQQRPEAWRKDRWNLTT